MPLTTDPNDPRLERGADTAPRPQSAAYLVLSDAERARGFVRPVRQSYVHVGPPGPQYPLRDLTDEEKALWGDDYVAFEVYPETESPKTGKFWTQAQLDKVGKGCGTLTTMALPIAETYAREPSFYGATYCTGCQMHLPVEEFVWDGTEERVGS